MCSLARLIEVSSPGRGAPEKNELPGSFREINRPVIEELESMLGIKNGFIAFESALSVFSADPSDIVKELTAWNGLLSNHYAFQENQLCAFAEDLFMGQYAISEDGVVKVDLESGRLESHSDSISDWAQTILDDYNYETGYPVGEEWQKANGRLANGYRLLPKRPFAMGGDFVSREMVAVKSHIGLQMLVNLSNQIRHLPNGTTVTITGWNPDEYT